MALANDANSQTGLCCPDYAAIASETELSEKTVQRATAKLVEDGFIERHRKRRVDGSLSRYFYTFPKGTLRPSPVDFESQSNHRHHKTESPDKNQELDQDLTPPPASPSKQERDNVWDALEAIFGKPTTPQHRKRFGKVQRELLADTSLTATAVAGEVGMRATRYRAKWPGCELTLEALAKHWPDLRNGNGAANGHGHEAEIPDVVLTVEDYREWKRTASPMQDALYQQRFDLAGDGLPA